MKDANGHEIGSKASFRATALEHQAADARVGLAKWSCQCGACRMVRDEAKKPRKARKPKSPRVEWTRIIDARLDTVDGEFKRLTFYPYAEGDKAFGVFMGESLAHAMGTALLPELPKTVALLRRFIDAVDCGEVSRNIEVDALLAEARALLVDIKKVNP